MGSEATTAAVNGNRTAAGTDAGSTKRRLVTAAGVAMKFDQFAIDHRTAVRQLPARRSDLRQLRRDHRPQWKLLSLPQLWQ
jgi:hypothetical protein